MNDSGDAFASGTLDVARCRGLVDDELSQLEVMAEQTYITEQEELSSWLVAWFCVLAPELSERSWRSRLCSLILNLQAREDYGYRGWYRSLLPQLAMFGLTRDRITQPGSNSGPSRRRMGVSWCCRVTPSRRPSKP